MQSVTKSSGDRESFPKSRSRILLLILLISLILQISARVCRFTLPVERRLFLLLFIDGLVLSLLYCCPIYFQDGFKFSKLFSDFIQPSLILVFTALLSTLALFFFTLPVTGGFFGFEPMLLSVGLVWWAIYFLVSFRSYLKQSFLIFIFGVASLSLTILYTQISYPSLENFNRNFKDYEKVVSLIKAGQLQPEGGYKKSTIAGTGQTYSAGVIKLPCKYSHLNTCGTRVKKEKNLLTVRFCSFELFDGYLGFVYRSDKTGYQQVNFKKIKDHWFLEKGF